MVLPRLVAWSGEPLASISTWTVLLVASFGVLAPSLRAQKDDFWSMLPAGKIITRCSELSDAHSRAADHLLRLDEAIEALKPADSPTALVNELHSMLRTECFLSATETNRIPRPDSALSLKHWWSNAGGRAWLRSLLELPRQGDIDALKSY